VAQRRPHIKQTNHGLPAVICESIMADDARPEGPIMDADTFHALGLDMRADAVSPGNPNAAYDAAVAAKGERALELQQAVAQLETALYQLGPASMRPPSPDRVPRGHVVPFLRWAGSKCYPHAEYDWWMYVPAAQAASADCAVASLCVFMDGHQYLDPTGLVRAATVFDNLIFAGEIEPILGIFITPGRRLSRYGCIRHTTDIRCCCCCLPSPATDLTAAIHAAFVAIRVPRARAESRLPRRHSKLVWLRSGCATLLQMRRSAASSTIA
jgi:hypothetical protein